MDKYYGENSAKHSILATSRYSEGLFFGFLFCCLTFFKSISNVLKANVKAALCLGPYYITQVLVACFACIDLFQLGHIYMNMLNVYKVYSEFISNAIASQGMLVLTKRV